MENTEINKLDLDTVTFEALNDTKYQDLAQAFKDLDIFHAFKAGIKKKDLVEKGWKEVVILRRQKEAGLSAEEIVESNKENAQIEKDIEKARLKGLENAAILEAKQKVEVVEAMDLPSIESIEASLVKINRDLSNSWSKGQKDNCIAARNKYEEMLKQAKAL